MRLLKYGSCGELEITADLFKDIPPYAILSHTWGEDEDEFNFNDLRTGTGREKSGYAKVQFCGEQAKKDGLDHFWIDTCCIDKASHNELSEAINSMFRWYQESVKCYVYLPDVTTHKRDSEGEQATTWTTALRSSRWFTRGWTLQELLAPKSVGFFSRDRELLGDKTTLSKMIHEITGIAPAALQGAPLSTFSVDEKLAWRENRNTKRTEDQVYSLLGIFNLHMPPLYGEGMNCWTRFKDELAKSFRHQLDETGPNLVTVTAQSTTDQIKERRQEMLSSLAFTQMDSRRSTIKRAHSNTCSWFLKHDAYLAWTDPNELPEHQGFLWITGKPGAGKSTLVKFLLANADKMKRDEEIVLSFFFNARGDELEKSTIGMYRSLLLQLLTKAPDLAEILGQFEVAFQEQSHSFSWTIEILQALLSSAIEKLGNRRLKCFVDALDECSEQEIRDMIVFWEELGQDALDNGCEVYTCFSSRHYPTIDIRNGRQMILEKEDGHGEDLAKYVRNRLRAGTGKYVEEVRNTICEMANGVFMWVVLVVDILNKEFASGRIFAVKKRLQEIPQGLSELFNDILRRDCTNLDDLLLCLQWILFARQPLSRQEFYFAMVSGLDPEPDNLDKWNPDHVTIEHMDRFLLNSSKGLAELTKTKSSTVQFIHESVRDFLLKDNGLYELWPGLGADLRGKSHDQLKQCCLNYLRANGTRCYPDGAKLPEANSIEARILRESLKSHYPFLEYACGHVLYHANQAADETQQEKFLTDFQHFDFRLFQRVATILERYIIRRYHTAAASLSIVLAENGFVNLIHTARRSACASEFQINSSTPMFIAAVKSGDVDTIRALAPSGTNFSHEDIVCLADFGRNLRNQKEPTLLLHAISTRQESVCEVLLASKAFDVDSKGRNKRNALSLAAEHSCERVVNLLLAEGIGDADSCCKVGRTPLSYAAEHGHVSILQSLIEHSADVNTRDKEERTPLSYAAQNGHVSTLRYLLSHSATNTIDNYGRTPLSYAAGAGQATAVEILLEHGGTTHLNLVDEDGNGETPLMRAASQADVDVLRVLLKNGADVYTMGRGGWTAMHYASAKGTLPVLDLLLQWGSSVYSKDFMGMTPLHRASQKGHVSVAKVLLERGADVDATDDRERTSIHLAAKDGQFDIVHLLLRSGGVIDARDGKGNTPLMYATYVPIDGENPFPSSSNFIWRNGKRSKMLELLIGEGANIHATNKGNRTALFNASSLHESRPCIEILLAHGIDLDVQDVHGRTALSYASDYGKYEAVQVLLESGASIHLADFHGRTALHFCVMSQIPRDLWLGTMLLLLPHGAQPDASASDGESPISIVAKRGDEAALRTLEHAALLLKMPKVRSSVV